MANLLQQTLARIVTDDYRTAAIFEKYNLDFCCKGKRKLADACAETDIPPALISAELEMATNSERLHHIPFNEMTVDQLITFIVVFHHSYVKQSMPQIYGHLGKVVAKHGDHFPFIREVFQLFSTLQIEMIRHMEEEENRLFPAMRTVGILDSEEKINVDLTTISGVIRAMETDHDEAGNLMTRIRVLTDNYRKPEVACNTFKLCLDELKFFEADLHRHVHIENNVLFPIVKAFVA